MTEEQMPRVNPLLERARIPGQTFALPSGGVFYTHDEIDPSVRNGEIVVHPMVTVDEMAMKTPDKLLNGTALDEVFRRCMPQVKQPLRLLAKDVDFLLICLRKVTYGDQIQIEYKHTCENAKEHSYLLPLDPLIASAKKLNSANAKEEYTLTLPNSQVVTLSPPRYGDMLEMNKTFANPNVTQDLVAMSVVDLTASLVESVDNISDREMIREWAQTITAGYARMIGDHLAKLATWGPNQQVEITCRDCNETVPYVVALNPIDFFS